MEPDGRSRPTAGCGRRTSCSISDRSGHRSPGRLHYAEQRCSDGIRRLRYSEPAGYSRSDAVGPVHVSLSTISVRLSRLLGEAHQQQQQHFVAAPVFGRPSIAEQGKLWIAVGGKTAAVERVRPLLEAASRGMTVVSDEPWRAHALKLGGNFMIAAMIQAMSEAFVFAESQGIAPDLFLETVNSALFQSAYYTRYSQTILHPPPVPGSTVAMGNKDIALFREAAAAFTSACRLPI